MQFLPIFTALLAAAGAYGQITSCATVPTDVATQEASMKAFNGRTPAPSTSNLLDCATATTLKAGIDAYRTALLANPTDGCFLIYTTTTLTDGFVVDYATLSQFVSGCG
ncbi:hypothetical protein DFH06DRAFT_1214623, partial [Mycena polygramma]